MRMTEHGMDFRERMQVPRNNRPQICVLRKVVELRDRDYISAESWLLGTMSTN